MNTRDLMMGLQSTAEFRKQHAYATLKHFPELKKSLQEFDNVNLQLGESHSNNQNSYSLNKDSKDNEFTRSDASARKSLNSSTNYTRPSTRVLDDLKKSSVDEITALSEFKKVLVESRRASKISQGLVPGAITSFMEKEATFSRANTAAEYEDTASIESRPHSVQSKSVSRSATTDPLQLANEKIAKVSLSFDFRSPNNPLTGFYGTQLDKKEFAQSLRRCLNINLSRSELDALFDSIDANGNGRLDGVEFVRYFFRVGSEEKSAARQRCAASLARRSSPNPNPSPGSAPSPAAYGDADVASAMRKLAEAAFRWDQNNYSGAASVFGFEAFLAPRDFQLQLEMSFAVRLTPAELGALLDKFRCHRGDQPRVDGYLFLKRFSALHKTVRAEYLHAQLAHKARKDAQMARSAVELGPKTLGR
mmetsp:Transcript_10431/g.15716  ORF Transcript_10431/g.15716 Transcript_10431/m.15716 type:complete len:420 (+) Transcript_10431:662-1921(+)